MKIAIINGPNLNLVGIREPDVYGGQSFEAFYEKLQEKYPDVDFNYYQSNVEGELVNKLQEYGFSSDGIILNAASYTHTSVAIGDAVAAINAPVVEVHVSNLAARESFRHFSYVSAKAAGCITGLGLKGYELALLFLIDKT